MENPPSDFYVKQAQFTRTTYRDIYPAIDPTASSNSQAGRAIVITGASQGIGRHGFVKSFARAGPKGIVLVARSAAELEAARQDILAINKEIEVLAVPTDARSPESVAALWGAVKETFGRADVLINNAGTISRGSISDTPVDDWWLNFEINARGTFLMTQGFLKLLEKEQKGTIVSLTSGMALMILPHMSSYSLTKLITLQLQAFVAAENPNVTAIALHPGIVHTEMVSGSFAPFAKDTFELVGGVGVWLATEKAAFLNGRYVTSNWSVDELVGRREEIVSQGKLSLVLKGDFGEAQFA
ncbi:Short chain dehydrogenase citE [Lachnellula suecica]|uniref:Short chain dehydrogenase citE n=1 Tax=Lachnellula suecica TaxID=602035 RepID=A0A8T9BVN3_9HELO|nr:Short chain dehydrogenase citE [Lachnellula suecica]